jgi:hypothetical protein
MKESVKVDIEQLTSQNIDIMDLYKRFGAILFRSKILSGQETIERLNKGKENQLVDLV